MTTNVIEAILQQNLVSYATVLLANCITEGPGQWLTVTLRVSGDAHEFSYKRMAFYDTAFLTQIFNRWLEWREEAGLSDTSVIPRTINLNERDVLVHLKLKKGLDFFERAKLLLHSLSPIHCQTPHPLR
jgi:hypothetical protein